MESIFQLLGKLDGVKGHDGKFTARCPAHDDRVSSLSITEKDDKILVKCHAGCAIEDILKPLELTLADLFPNGLRPRQDSKAIEQKEIERVYKYQDAQGRPLFEVVRFRPKSFAQRRPDGQWGLGGITPVLYHLPEVLTAVKTGDLLYIVEGEKDTDNLWAIGCITTTSPMGAGKWRDSYTEVLKNARVVIIPDNDKVGRAHAYQIAMSLHPVARMVKLLEVPGKAKDISDWLEAGNTWEDLDQLVTSAPPWQPPEEPEEAAAPLMRDFHLTDLGNAERLVAQYGNIIRYCYARRRWLVWSGKAWQWDEGAVVTALAKKTVRGIYHQVADEQDEKKRDALLSHAKRSESDARISAMMSLAQSEDGVPVQLGELDQHVFLFNCLNGTIDLSTGDLLPHRRRDMLTILCPVEYDPAATAPIWTRFLNRVTGDNRELAVYLQTAAGYSLTGDTRLQSLFFLWGLGNNGKSTFVTTIRKLAAGYGHKASTELFLARERGAGGPREDMANLYGKRFVVASEIEDGRRLAVVLIKEMTGGETITADRKYEHQVEFDPTHKIWLSGNHRPTITDTTLSIWRRVKLVPFTVTIPPEEVDDTLPQRLETEFPGILAWAVRGSVRCSQDGLREPTAVSSATMEYRQEQDILGEFIADNCVIEAGVSCSKSALRKAYEAWCTTTGTHAIGVRTFRSRLVEKGLTESKSGAVRLWRGIGIYEGQNE